MFKISGRFYLSSLKVFTYIPGNRVRHVASLFFILKEERADLPQHHDLTSFPIFFALYKKVKRLVLYK